MKKARRRDQPQPSAEVQESGTRWLLIRYEPVSLFSLRMTHATNKGGKTLLIPTPYSFKLALIDASFRYYATDEAADKARELFDWIKHRSVRFKPPQDCIVQNTFVKIRQEERGAESGIYTSTIAYREWCFFRGFLTAAIAADGFSEEQVDAISRIGAHVNYFGKRGCFWQFRDAALHDGPLDDGYSLTANAFETINPAMYGVSQFLDDFGEQLCNARDGFERISTYNEGTIRLGQHRVLTPTLLPYVRIRASRNFTHYRNVIKES